MGGKVNNSKASRTIIDNTLNATGTVTALQNANEFYSVKNQPANDSDIKILTVSVGTTDWTIGSSYQDVQGYGAVSFVPVVQVAASVANTTMDLRIIWSPEQNATYSFYQCKSTFNALTGGLQQIDSGILYWRFPVTAVGKIPMNSIVLPRAARYINIEARLSAASTPSCTVALQGTFLSFSREGF